MDDGNSPAPAPTSYAPSPAPKKSSSASAEPSSAASGADRDARVKLELDSIKGENLGIKDMKAALAQLGVSTVTFIEKSEFARALAEVYV